MTEAQKAPTPATRKAPALAPKGYPPDLATALAILQTRLPTIEKTERAEVEMKSGGKFSYAYANLATVSKAILPLLGELGMSFIAMPTVSPEGKLVLRVKLLHVSGEFEAGEYPLSGSTPQTLGGSITYARRYALCAVTGIAPEDDDDAAAAEAETAPASRTAQRAARSSREPASGRGPSAQRSRASSVAEGRPPLPGNAGPTLATKPMVQKIVITIGELGINDRDDRLTLVGGLIGRKLGSGNDLTMDEGHRVIDLLNEANENKEPLAYLRTVIAEAAAPVDDPPAPSEGDAPADDSAGEGGGESG